MLKPIISDIIFPCFFYYLSVYAKPPLEQRHLLCRKTPKLSSGNDDTAAFFKKISFLLYTGSGVWGGIAKYFYELQKRGKRSVPTQVFFSRPPADDDGFFADTTHALCLPRRVSRKKSGAKIFFPRKKRRETTLGQDFFSALFVSLELYCTVPNSKENLSSFKSVI